MRQLLLALLISIISACSKNSDSDNPPDNISVITINTPTAGFTYLNGGTLRVEGEINDGDKVTSARVQIKNKTTNAIYFEQTVSAGNITRYFFNWNWVISGVSSPQAAIVSVTSRDTRGFEISKAVEVNLTP